MILSSKEDEAIEHTIMSSVPNSLKYFPRRTYNENMLLQVSHADRHCSHRRGLLSVTEHILFVVLWFVLRVYDIQYILCELYKH